MKIKGISRQTIAAILLLISFFVSLALVLPAHSGVLDLPRLPSISPDGSEIVFSAGGDLWLVPSTGGEARRLTRHHLDDMHSNWSPDGQSIVFTSMRDGYMNLWRIERDGTRIKQLTYSDRFMRNPDWALDGDGRDIITFSGLLEGDVYRDQRPYKLSAQGGQYERLHHAFGSEPRLSPDTKKVVFTRGGHYHSWNRRHYRGPDAMNVWVYHSGEDRFEAVTARNGDDGGARWVDSSRLIFMSDRQFDTVNLYLVDLNDAVDGEERPVFRLTSFKGRDIQYFDVSRDGSKAVIHVWDRLYTLDLRDPEAKPRPLSFRTGDDGRDRHVLRKIDRDITEAALSPDGRVMAYIAYGRIYVRHMDEFSPTRAVTPKTHARHRDLAWSPDGLYLYFTCDADGTSSIYKVRVHLTREEIRQAYENLPAETFEEQLAEEVTETIDVSEPLPILLTFETLDEADDHASGTSIEDLEDPFAPVDPLDPIDPLDPTDPPGMTDPSDPYDPGVPASDPEPAGDLPEAPPLREELPVPLPPVDFPEQQNPDRWHDAVQFLVLSVVAGKHNDRGVSPSPDGNAIAFRRGRGDLVVMDLGTGRQRTLVKGWDSSLHWRWSPDGRYIAYAQNDLNFSTNIYIVPADGSKDPVNITRHPRNDLNPRWSADGRILTFISNRSGNSYNLYRVYLDAAMENQTRRELVNYYKDARTEAGKRRPLPTGTPASAGPGSAAGTGSGELDLEGAWRRVERISASPVHQTANEMTPGGDRYVFNSGNEGLIVMNWDGSDRRRLGERCDVQHLSITGDRVIYIAKGRVGVAPLNGGGHQYPDISDRIRIDLREESLQKFREAARVIEESFYRPDMKGLDWQRLVADYENLIERARTASEFSDVANRLLGELAASHMGISNPGPGSELREPSGRLGVTYERVVLKDGRPGYRVTGIVPGGPAERGPVRLQVNDIITSIDIRAFEEHDTLLERLRGKVGREVIVGFERPVRNRHIPYHALLTPISFDAFSRLRYDAFREDSSRKVSELSDGRIGYIHIQAMNQSSLEEFQAHLYAAAEGKDGLIIDVRNNAGGHTTDRILTSIMAAEHAYTIPAGADPYRRGRYPQDRLDAPRYTLPINMLANEKSYSNAEIMAHAFSTLKRGTLVGEQTYGGVISTGSYPLIDGATVRRPFRGWYLPNGTDMEQNGAVPDLKVKHTPADEVAGRDHQLETAVKDLMERIDPHKIPRKQRSR
jgi:tricorn protease